MQVVVGLCLAQDGHILFGGVGGGIGFTSGATGGGHGAGFSRFHGTGVGPGSLNAHEIARAEYQLGGGDAGGHRLFRTELEFLNGIRIGRRCVERHPCRLSHAAEESGQVVRKAEHVSTGHLSRDVDVPVVFHRTANLGEAGGHDFAGAAGGFFLVEGGVTDGVRAFTGDGLGFGEGQPGAGLCLGHGAGQQQEAQEGTGEADHGAAWASVASFRWW